MLLVHPPGGMVGGDRLEVDAALEAGTHALVTTPSATRYRSTGALASRQAVLRAAGGARLERLPLETLAYRGCSAFNGVQLQLAPARRQALLDSAREVLAASPLHRAAGATAPQPQVMVLRLLAHGVEPAVQCLTAVRAAWRRLAWALAAEPPRIWRL